VSKSNEIKVCVCQLGARLHYGAARSFERRSALQMLATDLCGSIGWPGLFRAVPAGMRPAALRRLLGRDPIEIPKERIVMFPRLGLEYKWRLSRCKTEEERLRVCIQTGRQFGGLIRKAGFKGATHVYTFSGAGLDILEAARDAGLYTLVEQPAAPAEIEQQIMAEEHERYPDWEPSTNSDKVKTEYAMVQRREWEIADKIIAPSKFVAVGLQRLGVPDDRCVTVPYGVSGSFSQVVHEKHEGPLRVLTVGGVRLQKGPQYTSEAAKLLGYGFEFRLVGTCVFPRAAKAELGRALRLVGNVPRSEVVEHFKWADVFLFPTLCDGFGCVLLEALASGLPVITTTNSGIAIRDGVDGFVVPIRDAPSIADRLHRLASEPGLLAEMSHNARERSQAFTLDAYGDRLYGAVAGVSSVRVRVHASI
jgi:glycosyltransferase involved in cell wall biosynthesis